MRYLLALLLTTSLFAGEFEPWWTGSLLSVTGKTIGKGNTNIQPYVFVTDSFGHYDTRSRKQSALTTKKINSLFLYTHGFTNFFDIKIAPQFFINSAGSQTSARLGDFPLTLAFQAMLENPHTFKPNLRITVRETFPSGSYEKLNPKKNGTDSSGSGSYQSSLGLNFQKTHHLWARHYLRWRLNFEYTLSTPVHVHGINTYGGTPATRGTVYPGNVLMALCAFEFNFNQNLVLACDLMEVWSDKRRFSGTPGLDANGQSASLTKGVSNTLSIAPALEYNFTKNVGIIGGIWKSLAYHNSQDFISYVLSFNYVY